VSRDRGIFERPPGSGVWYARYKDEHGRLHKEKVGPKGLAQKVYQKRKTQIAERRFFPERFKRRDVLLADYVTDFLRERVEGRLRNVKHYAQYSVRWKNALSGKTLRQVMPEDVARYVARRRAAGKAPATVNRELSFLRRLYNVAIKDRLAETNPVTPDLFFKENNQRVRFLTDDEEARLMSKLPASGDRSMLLVALHTGLRRGEQFQLRWCDVDFTTGIITVPRSKHGEARRIPTNDTVRATLGALPSRMRSAWVFPSDTGETPRDGQNFVNRVFRPALAEAGIDDFHWHDLRHTFASRLAMAGVDLNTIRELMGHKTLAMTLRYAHLSPAHQLDAVQRLNRPAIAQPGDPVGDPGPERAKVATGSDAEATEDTSDSTGGARNRTADLGIMRPSL